MIVFTTKNKYKQNMKEIINTILNHNKPKKIFLINIAFPSKSLKEKNYDVENQIIKYNNILNHFQNETISIIDLFSFTKNNPDSLVGDEHISKKGHNFILDNLKSYITTLY
jgi:lysophospholipase L1-like esterase